MPKCRRHAQQPAQERMAPRRKADKAPPGQKSRTASGGVHKKTGSPAVAAKGRAAATAAAKAAEAKRRAARTAAAAAKAGPPAATKRKAPVAKAGKEPAQKKKKASPSPAAKKKPPKAQPKKRQSAKETWDKELAARARAVGRSRSCVCVLGAVEPEWDRSGRPIPPTLEEVGGWAQQWAPSGAWAWGQEATGGRWRGGCPMARRRALRTPHTGPCLAASGVCGAAKLKRARRQIVGEHSGLTPLPCAAAGAAGGGVPPGGD